MRLAFALLALLGVLGQSPQEPAPGKAPLCYALRHPVAVDGDLSDWDRRGPIKLDQSAQLDTRGGLDRAEDWKGADDASLTAYLAWDRDALYLAGEVKDDQRVFDDRLWFNGDCIELSLDFERGAGVRGPRGTDGEWQLCLMPYNPGRAWGVLRHGRTSVLAAGGLEGVEVASQPTDPGEKAGYTFEARLPFANFPGFASEDGRPRRIGVNLAINDHDKAADGRVERSYLLLQAGGAAGGLLTRGSFVDLDFVGDPAPADADASTVDVRGVGSWTMLVLLALGLIFLVAKTSLRAFEWVDRRLPRWRRTAFVALLLGLLLVKGAPPLVARLLEWRAEIAFSRKAAVVGKVVADVAERSALQEGRGLTEPKNLLTLLRGDVLATRPSYDYTCLELRPGEPAPNLRYTNEGTPVREYGFELPALPQFYFPLPEPTVLRRLFVFGSVRFDEELRRRPDASGVRDQALEIGLRLLDGKLRTEQFPLIDRTLFGAAMPPLSDRFGLAWEDDDRAVESVEQYFLGVPTVGDELVSAIVVSLRDPQVNFRLHGITYVPKSGDNVLTPLPLAKTSLTGVPAAFWDGYPKGVERVLGAAPNDKATIPVGRRLDALWLFYTSLDPRALDPALHGVEVGRVIVRAAPESGVADQVAPLRAGASLFYGLYDPEQRPAEMESRVAFRWSPEPGVNEHLEMLEIRLKKTTDVAEVRVENLGPLSGIAVYAMTGGVLARPAPLPASSTLVDSGTSLQVQIDLAGQLQDLGLAVVADGALAVSDFRDPALDRALKGAREPFRLEGASQAKPSDEPARVPLRGEPYLLKTFPLQRADGATLLVAAAAPVAGVQRLSQVERAALFLWLLLAVPVLMFHVLDVASRIARLRLRLTILLVTTSLVPIVILFAVLYNVVASDRARLREQRAVAALGEVRHRLDLLLAQTQKTSEQVVNSEVVRALRPDAPLDVEGTKAYLKDVVGLQQAATPGLDLMVRLEVELYSGQRIRFHDRPQGESSSRFDLSARGVFYHWGELLLLWSQDFSAGDFHRRVAVAGAVKPQLLAELGALTSADVALRTLDGQPIAGAKTASALAPGDVERLRRDNQPITRRLESGALAAFDLVKLGEGEPAALIELTLPRDAFLLDVAFGQMPLETFFFWFCVLGLAVAVFMGSVSTRRITTPIEALETAARRVARGALDVTVDVGAKGEVGRLAESFNQMTGELKRKAAERGRLERAMIELTRSIDPEAVASVALAALAEDPPARSCALYVRDPENDRWVRIGAHPRLDAAAPPEMPRSPLLDHVAKKREPLRAARGQVESAPPPSDAERALFGAEAAGAGLLLPLALSDRCIGFAWLRYGEGERDADVAAALPTLSHLAGQVAVSLENARLYRLAVADPETGLYVESYFKNRCAEEVDRAHSRDGALALLSIQVEGLRRLERSQGKEAQREAVLRLARFLKSESRDMVLLARSSLGFLLLLPEARREQAEEFRQRILRGIAALDAGEFVAQLGLNVHAGLAVYPENGASLAFLLDAAANDLARSRRNVVRAALEAAPTGAPPAELDFHPYVFKSAAMKELLGQAARVAQTNASVLLLGDTGTGKEVIADLIHRFSDRAHKPFVALNCSAVPEALLEAELFGYERGAFTGAVRAKPGQLELADGGTLFLDEIGDLPLALQGKLLRVLQDRVVVRLGATRPFEVDVRIVAATHRDLAAMMDQGLFRSDLYFRLKVVTFTIPPLKARRDDIPALAEAFVRQVNEESGKPGRALAPAALDRLFAYDWPGNVRELKNVVSRALLMSDGDLVLPGALQFEAERKPPSPSEPAPPAPAPAVPIEPAEPPPTAAPIVPATGGELNDRQRTLLSSLAKGATIRSREYCDLVKVPERTGLRDLSDLVERGRLVRVGRRRGAAYRLPE